MKNAERRLRGSSQDTVFKGYLHYKTITYQNVSSETQIKDFFIS